MTLSAKATDARRDYLRSWNAEHPEKNREACARYWEKKAKEFYGVDYVPPKDGEGLSRQARRLRNRYQKEYRKKNPDIIKKNVKDYWERKARAGSTKEG